MPLLFAPTAYDPRGSLPRPPPDNAFLAIKVAHRPGTRRRQSARPFLIPFFPAGASGRWLLPRFALLFPLCLAAVTSWWSSLIPPCLLACLPACLLACFLQRDDKDGGSLLLVASLHEGIKEADPCPLLSLSPWRARGGLSLSLATGLTDQRQEATLAACLPFSNLPLTPAIRICLSLAVPNNPVIRHVGMSTCRHVKIDGPIRYIVSNRANPEHSLAHATGPTPRPLPFRSVFTGPIPPLAF